MKKTLGRLGSVAAAVGLLAAGLVGTATSASADSQGTACAYHVGIKSGQDLKAHPAVMIWPLPL